MGNVKDWMNVERRRRTRRAAMACESLEGRQLLSTFGHAPLSRQMATHRTMRSAHVARHGGTKAAAATATPSSSAIATATTTDETLSATSTDPASDLTTDTGSGADAPGANNGGPGFGPGGRPSGRPGRFGAQDVGLDSMGVGYTSPGAIASRRGFSGQAGGFNNPSFSAGMGGGAMDPGGMGGRGGRGFSGPMNSPSGFRFDGATRPAETITVSEARQTLEDDLLAAMPDTAQAPSADSLKALRIDLKAQQDGTISGDEATAKLQADRVAILVSTGLNADQAAAVDAAQEALQADMGAMRDGTLADDAARVKLDADHDALMLAQGVSQEAIDKIRTDREVLQTAIDDSLSTISDGSSSATA